MNKEWQDLKDAGELVSHANSPVYRVLLPDGSPAYMRPNDGSAFMLAYASSRGLTVPSVLDVADGWLIVSGIPGEPLSTEQWCYDEERLVTACCRALRALEGAKVTHGDCTLPNMLARYDDGPHGEVGFVDWGTGVDRYVLGTDIAAVIWSMHYNGCSMEAQLEVLKRRGWELHTVEEVDRLRALYESATSGESN